MSACVHKALLSAVDDEYALRTALERYDDIDVSFRGSREATLLTVSRPYIASCLYLLHAVHRVTQVYTPFCKLPCFLLSG